MSEHFTCVDCGRGFTLSYNEQRRFRERGLSLPKRCEACRSRRRYERDLGNAPVSGPPARPSLEAHHWPAEFFQAEMETPETQARPSSPPRLTAPAQRSNPYARFGVLSLGFVLLAGIVALLVGLDGWLVGLVVVLAVNVITLVLYRYDKAIAGGGQTRVPELILLALALLGGSLAAFVAMYLFSQRHKTQTRHFVIVYWLIVAVQMAALCSSPLWLNWTQAINTW
jgi:uncharacterized membrane protein YsdA (DUF1294 family)